MSLLLGTPLCWVGRPSQTLTCLPCTTTGYVSGEAHRHILSLRKRLYVSASVALSSGFLTVKFAEMCAANPIVWEGREDGERKARPREPLLFKHATFTSCFCENRCCSESQAEKRNINLISCFDFLLSCVLISWLSFKLSSPVFLGNNAFGNGTPHSSWSRHSRTKLLASRSC